MRLTTIPEDTIETVDLMTCGSYAGTRLRVKLNTQEACRMADKLIRRGRWRIVEQHNDDCDCERCDERNGVPQFVE